MKVDGARPAWDVVIVGGGPAGASAALSLRQHAPGLRVLLLESSRYDDVRIGETLAPTAQRVLQQLGLWDALRDEGHLDAYSTWSNWGGVANRHDFVTSLHGDGLHLDRTVFDRFLADSAAERGIEVRLGHRVREVVRSEDGSLGLKVSRDVDAQGAGAGWHRAERREPEFVSARFLVDATGRRAVVARGLGVAQVDRDSMIGSFMFFAESSEDVGTMVESVPEGWWYSARLPGRRMVAALMTEASICARLRLNKRESWLQALSRAKMTRNRLLRAEPLEGPLVKKAGVGHLDDPCGAGWLAVGDAAWTLDPLSGQGIVKALSNGMWAAFAVSDVLTGKANALEKYRRLVAAEIEQHLKTRAEVYEQERRWPDEVFWRRHRGLSTQ